MRRGEAATSHRRIVSAYSWLNSETRENPSLENPENPSLAPFSFFRAWPLFLFPTLALAHDYRPALEQLLEIVRRDRKWQDEAARKAMLDLFTLLGGDAQYDDLVREFRIALARTLN